VDVLLVCGEDTETASLHGWWFCEEDVIRDWRNARPWRRNESRSLLDGRKRVGTMLVFMIHAVEMPMFNMSSAPRCGTVVRWTAIEEVKAYTRQVRPHLFSTSAVESSMKPAQNKMVIVWKALSFSLALGMIALELHTAFHVVLS